MKRHLAYLRYLLYHKLYVWIACGHCGVGWWRSIIHDWHKFLPSEWLAYAHTFYAPDGTRAKYAETPAFARAWNFHQKRAKHHWQYWLLMWDRCELEPVQMPVKYAREMVADWWGAGRCITGKWDAPAWYYKNRDKIILHSLTRIYVEHLLESSGRSFTYYLTGTFAPSIWSTPSMPSIPNPQSEFRNPQ